MELDNGVIDFGEVERRLQYFYEGEEFSIELIKKDLRSNKLAFSPDDFITYLHTSLLDEKLVEVRFDDSQDLYFTKIIDSLVENEERDSTNISESNNGEPGLSGKYLSNFTHITTLPLEPGMGNYHIRSSEKVVMRIFLKSFAFEFGTHFKETTTVESAPALNFEFPVIGRMLYGEREYRARVIDDLELHAIVIGKRKQPDLYTRPIDISASGIAIRLEKKDLPHFFVGEQRKLSITDSGEHRLDVTGKICHITAVRKIHGVSYICGLQLELATRDSIRKLESLVGYVQRAHLQSLSGLSRKAGRKLLV